MRTTSFRFTVSKQWTYGDDALRRFISVLVSRRFDPWLSGTFSFSSPNVPHGDLLVELFCMTHEQSPPPIALRYQSSGREAVGLILVDAKMKALYISSAARDILLNGESTQTIALREHLLARRIQSLLMLSDGNCDSQPTFVSGRRRYGWRVLPLGPAGVGPQTPHSALLLQRISRRNEHLRRLVEVFKLTPRECQTLQLVAEGLTSKEIATKMEISPHTVRAFLHFIMVKLDVTTRSGIVGRVNAMFTPWERNF